MVSFALGNCLLNFDAVADQIQVRGKGAAPPSKGKQADCADGPQAVGEAEGGKEQCAAAQDSESATSGSERFVYDFDLKEPFPDSESEEEFAVEPSGSTCRNKRMCVRRLDADILEALWATDVESSGEDAVFDESEEE